MNARPANMTASYKIRSTRNLRPRMYALASKSMLGILRRKAPALDDELLARVQETFVPAMNALISLGNPTQDYEPPILSLRLDP